MRFEMLHVFDFKDYKVGPIKQPSKNWKAAPLSHFLGALKANAIIWPMGVNDSDGGYQNKRGPTHLANW